MYQLIAIVLLTMKINKRTMPNKSVPMGKILKINKRTGTFIWQTRVHIRVDSCSGKKGRQLYRQIYTG